MDFKFIYSFVLKKETKKKKKKKNETINQKATYTKKYKELYLLFCPCFLSISLCVKYLPTLADLWISISFSDLLSKPILDNFCL